MIFEEPYFLKNPAWYYYDEEEGIYRLTDKAPEKAVESYKEYYSRDYDDGYSKIS